MPEREDDKNTQDTPPLHQGFRLLPGGDFIFLQIGDYKEAIRGQIFEPEKAEQYDVRSYFQDKLKVFHLGRDIVQQYIGAPLPAARAEVSLDYKPTKRLNWLQPDITFFKMAQHDKRKSEKQVMGDSANDVIERGGVEPQKLSPWAHTKPDHLNFLNRDTRKLRIPGYVGANQVHTAFESAAKMLAKEFGEIEVTRKVGEPIAGNSGLRSDLKLGFVLRDKNDEIHHFTHDQPYFTSEGARNGDEKAIFRYMQIQKQLLDAGEPTLADNLGLTPEKRAKYDSAFSKEKLIDVNADYLTYMDTEYEKQNTLLENLKSTYDVNASTASSSDDHSSDTSDSSLDERSRSRKRNSHER